MKALSIFLFLVLGIHLVIAFVTLDWSLAFDVTEWDEPARLFYAFYCLCVALPLSIQAELV